MSKDENKMSMQEGTLYAVVTKAGLTLNSIIADHRTLQKINNGIPVKIETLENVYKKLKPYLPARITFENLGTLSKEEALDLEITKSHVVSLCNNKNNHGPLFDLIHIQDESIRKQFFTNSRERGAPISWVFPKGMDLHSFSPEKKNTLIELRDICNKLANENRNFEQQFKTYSELEEAFETDKYRNELDEIFAKLDDEELHVYVCNYYHYDLRGTTEEREALSEGPKLWIEYEDGIIESELPFAGAILNRTLRRIFYVSDQIYNSCKVKINNALNCDITRLKSLHYKLEHRAIDPDVPYDREFLRKIIVNKEILKLLNVTDMDDLSKNYSWADIPGHQGIFVIPRDANDRYVGMFDWLASDYIETDVFPILPDNWTRDNAKETYSLSFWLAHQSDEPYDIF